MTVIIVFFLTHWFLSLFLHTFFLHRFASHKLYETSKNWERFFYFSTWFVQGSSYLIPRAYGVMHRMHHEYSDSEEDPHSPHFFKDVYQMMMSTKKMYQSFIKNEKVPDAKFTADYLPVWEKLDKFGDHNITRLFFILSYTAVYVIYAPSFWWYLLLPIHFLMGPVQGAIVNWCGHKYGYRNFNSTDQSKNSTPWGILLMGELFQNNHHHNKEDANFAKKWYEFDTTYLIMKGLHAVGIIKIKKLPS